MSIGPAEIVIVLILALLVFGPKRLPQMGKSLGKGVREFRKAADTAKQEFGLGEVTDQINEVKSTFTEPIKEVTGTFTDLKSSVDVKSAIEAPVAAKGAATAGAAAVSASLVGADVPGTPADVAAQDVTAGVEGYVPPAPVAAVPSAPEAPSAPESPDVAAAGDPSAAPGGDATAASATPGGVAAPPASPAAGA
jgi:sec-independent protein translocase protein TatA